MKTYKELEAIALENYPDGIRALLEQERQPGITDQQAAVHLADEFAARAAEVGLYLEALIDEGEAVWQSRWDELGVSLDWLDQVDGVAREVAVNAILAKRLRELAA